ncbi:MAG: TIGR00153 family protein [Mariprofundaceae bacterium]
MVRRSSITSMFAGSPVKPLQQHMEKVCECVRKLPDFFKAIAAENYDEAEKIQQSISKLETEADSFKHDLRMQLPNTLFMPMPREQILDIVKQQDKIANVSKDIAGIVIGRKAQLPEPIAALFIAFVQSSVDAANQAKIAINQLDELIEAGFRGKEIIVVQDMISKLDDLEHEADKIERQLRHALFSIEHDYPPLNMMFLYRVIDWIGKLADVSQRVGSRLQMLLAK